MVAWPVLWQERALVALGVPPSDYAYSAITSWQASTPLPAYSYNPLGMPAGSSGAKRYLGTGYAQFASIGLFYAALGAFAQTYQASLVTAALRSDGSYSAAWCAVHSLGWPAAQTESDYPAVLLDLTSPSFRESVNATPVALRKTSGIITAPNSDVTTSITSIGAVKGATQSLRDAAARQSSTLRRNNCN
jgi:hypothetical protein